MSQKTQTQDGVTSTGAHAVELDALEGLAAQADADHTGTLPNGELIADQPQPVNYAMEAAGSVDMFAALVAGYCPPAGELWSTDKKAAVSAALAPVMEKYGFTLGALPCEILLIVTAGPLLYQTSRMIAGQMAKEKSAKPARAAPVPGAQADAPATARHPQEALYQ